MTSLRLISKSESGGDCAWSNWFISSATMTMGRKQKGLELGVVEGGIREEVAARVEVVLLDI
jgi:hypothetical protein